MENARLTCGRGGVFWKGEGCCGGVEKYCCSVFFGFLGVPFKLTNV